MEIPQYSVKANSTRMLVARILLLVVLAPLFYVALWLNLRLGFAIDVPLIVNILIVIVLIVAVVIEIIKFHVIYSQHTYLFYTNRVIFQKKDKLITFFYKDYEKSELKQNLLDKTMKTGTIRLKKDFIIGPVNKPKKIYEYLLKLISYHKRQRSSISVQQKSNQAFTEQTRVKNG